MTNLIDMKKKIDEMDAEYSELCEALATVSDERVAAIMAAGRVFGVAPEANRRAAELNKKREELYAQLIKAREQYALASFEEAQNG